MKFNNFRDIFDWIYSKPKLVNNKSNFTVLTDTSDSVLDWLLIYKEGWDFYLDYDTKFLLVGYFLDTDMLRKDNSFARPPELLLVSLTMKLYILNYEEGIMVELKETFEEFITSCSRNTFKVFYEGDAFERYGY